MTPRPKFAPNQGPADYLETTEVKQAKLSLAMSESKRAEIAQLDRLLDSLGQMGNSDPPCEYILYLLIRSHTVKGQFKRT